CNQGQDEWWAHSLMFPPGYVPPPVASVWNWGALFDFHNSSPGGGQPNFMVYATPTGLELHMAGGPNTVNRPSDPGYYSIAIGPITKNVWYDFVYHVKWSSGSDGLFQAWLNGKQVMNYSGPNLYVSQSCYLKIANYHTALGVPVSVVHSRVVMAHTQADVQIGSGGTPPPTVPVPNVVGQTQAAATSAITSAGLTVGTVTQQSSTTVASGSVISESPAAGTSVASASAVNLVVSSGECGWPDTSGGHERHHQRGPHRRYGHAAVEHYGGLRQRDQREPGCRHERGECFGRQPRRLERSDATTTTAAAACRDEGPRLRLQRQWQVRHPVA
ncbi:MAG: PASTA domain-containing protein, partial [Gammaproteobacteria bacterium]